MKLEPGIYHAVQDRRQYPIDHFVLFNESEGKVSTVQTIIYLRMIVPRNVRVKKGVAPGAQLHQIRGFLGVNSKAEIAPAKGVAIYWFKLEKGLDTNAED